MPAVNRFGVQSMPLLVVPRDGKRDRPRRRRAASGRVGAAVGAGARRVNSRSGLERGGASRREPATRVPRLAGKRSRRIDPRPMGKAVSALGRRALLQTQRGADLGIQRGGAADATGRDDYLSGKAGTSCGDERGGTRDCSAITSRVEMVAALGTNQKPRQAQRQTRSRSRISLVIESRLPCRPRRDRPSMRSRS